VKLLLLLLFAAVRWMVAGVTLVVEAALRLKHCCTACCLQLQPVTVLQAHATTHMQASSAAAPVHWTYNAVLTQHTATLWIKLLIVLLKYRGCYR
jgi:hypothetical protein